MQAQSSSPITTGPAIWFLTTGTSVVGPVHTELLLRGIAAGRVPEGCYVARERWSNWRELHHIREVSAYYRSLSAGESAPVESGLDVFAKERPRAVTIEDFRSAEDVDDCFKIALQLSVAQCTAETGLVHRSLPPHIGLVTTHAWGKKLRYNIGQVVPWHDATRGAAMDQPVLLGAPTTDEWARTGAMRMNVHLQHVAGVAVLPVRYDDGPQALIELGRSDHGFRISDERKLLEIKDALLQRVDQLRF